NLQDIMRRNIRAGRLTYSTDLTTLSRKKAVIFMAQDVPHYLEETAMRVARLCGDDTVLVISTPVQVGTAERVERKIQESGLKVTVISQPMFLTAGCAVEDFHWPDRILLGSTNGDGVGVMKQLYRSLVMRGVPVIVTGHATAELVREASTAFMATKISFINEIATLCEHVNADAVDLALALGLDKRVSPRCLQPGAALGGAFVESEMDSLAQLAQTKGVRLTVLNAARVVNTNLCERIVEKISMTLHSLSGKQVGLLGLAFKPNTSSVASSSSLILAKRLVQGGAQIRAYDPVAMPDAKLEFDMGVNYCDSPYMAAEGSDALVVGTGWPEFRALDFHRIKRSLRQPVIVDTKNMLDPVRIRAMGFEYVGMGRA
ncbi:MAG TPA: nucleotide sugar dehydrogenase, partial [Terriglobales bacterium]|nr:nucleotide sugar dehydrogenase [Terriglobales bacterium]